jgi:hypothetical protein
MLVLPSRSSMEECIEQKSYHVGVTKLHIHIHHVAVLIATASKTTLKQTISADVSRGWVTHISSHDRLQWIRCCCVAGGSSSSRAVAIKLASNWDRVRCFPEPGEFGGLTVGTFSTSLLGGNFGVGTREISTITPSFLPSRISRSKPLAFCAWRPWFGGVNYLFSHAGRFLCNPTKNGSVK